MRALFRNWIDTLAMLFQVLKAQKIMFLLVVNATLMQAKSPRKYKHATISKKAMKKLSK